MTIDQVVRREQNPGTSSKCLRKFWEFFIEQLQSGPNRTC